MMTNFSFLGELSIYGDDQSVYTIALSASPQTDETMAVHYRSMDLIKKMSEDD